MDTMTGEALRTFREFKKWSGQQLADELGTTAATISRWENNITPIPAKMVKAIRKIDAPVTVTAEIEVFARANAIATRRGITLQDAVSEALRAWIARHSYRDAIAAQSEPTARVAEGTPDTPSTQENSGQG